MAISRCHPCAGLWRPGGVPPGVASELNPGTEFPPRAGTTPQFSQRLVPGGTKRTLTQSFVAVCVAQQVDQSEIGR